MSEEEDTTFSEDNNNDLFLSTENNDQYPISSNKVSSTSTGIEPTTPSLNSTTKNDESELAHKRKKLARKRTESDIDQIVNLISAESPQQPPAITKEKTSDDEKTNNTNAVYTTSPRNEQAKKINEYKQLVDKFTILFGDDHLRTNEIKHILAARLYKAGQFDEALKIFTELKVFYENAGSEDNKDKTLFNIAEKCILCRIKLNDISGGGVTDEIIEICMHRYKTIYQCDDTEVWKKHTKQLMDILMEHKYYLEAERILSELLDEADRSLSVNKVGEDEDAFMEMMREMKMMLAHCYKDLEQYQKSLDMYLDVYALIKDDEYVLPNPREDMLSIKELMADLYCKVEDFEKALGMYFELYSDYIELYGGECTETLSIRTSIAEVLLRQEKVEDSLKIYMAVFESYLNLPDTKESIKIHMKHIIGHVYLKEERLFEALQTFRDVLYEYTLLHHKKESRHADILEAKSSVACALLKEKKFDESKTLYKEVWECYKEIHGEDDERTVSIENILVDLDRLDLMFTNEDRVVIDENVRLNEETHFGSQDFEKFILPKLTFDNDDGSDGDSTKEEDEKSENKEREINSNTNPEDVILHDDSKKEEPEINNVPNTEELIPHEDSKSLNPEEDQNDTSDDNKDDDSVLNTSKEIDHNNKIKDGDDPNEAMAANSDLKQPPDDEDDTRDTTEKDKTKDIDDEVNSTNENTSKVNSEQFDKDKLPSETNDSQGQNDPNPPSTENFDKRKKDEQNETEEPTSDKDELLDDPTRENKKPQPGENEIIQPKETDDDQHDDIDLDEENPKQNQTPENEISQVSENAISKPWKNKNEDSENEDSWSEDKWVNVPLNASGDDDIMEDIKEQNKNRKDGKKKKTKGSCCVIS